MKILEVAKRYVRQKEIPGNHGWLDKKFQDKLVNDGWLDGEAWCAVYQEMIWEEAYPTIEKELDKLFSKNCVQTYRNFVAAGYTVSDIPFVGALGIMRMYNEGKATEKGHALLVIEKIQNAEWISNEGNTNEAGSREGEVVAEKHRTLLYKPTGLRMLGFIDIRGKYGLD
jgi:hypothetical protein